MRITRNSRAKSAPQVEDVILFAVHDRRFAIAANAVDEIRNLDGLQPHAMGFLQSKLARVKFSLVRENKDKEKTNYIVDAGAQYGIAGNKPSRVLVFRHCSGGLLVDNIDRMAQISTVIALPLAFTGEERSWYRGLAVIEGQVIPVVNPEAIINKGEVAVLTAGKPASAAASVKGAASA